ncbi:MAG: hypothetical protein IRY99_26695 [Isosphaeraceae bacterium]|nr:hypothetical protein [Isosphaeraceae bacterium]
MAQRTPLATLPGSAPHERLLVELRQRGDGRLVIELREQHHAEGIGWFDQRTLALEPRQFRMLQSVLGLTALDLEADEDSPVLLPFPGPRGDIPKRQAIGDGV